MSDGPQEYRRSSDHPVGERMTVVEIQLINLGKRFEEHVDKSDQLIEKLDNRADRQDIMLARLLAGVAIAMFLSQLLTPVILRSIGLHP